MRLNPESIARASSRHPWRTVGVWAVVLFAGFAALSTLLSPALSNDFDFTNSPEAIQAQKLLEQKGLEQDVSPENSFVVGRRGGRDERSRVRRQGERGPRRTSAAWIRRSCSRSRAGIPSPSRTSSDPQVAALGPIDSEDGTAVLFTVILTGDTDKTAPSRSTNSNDDPRAVQHGRHDHVRVGGADLDRRLQEDLGGGLQEGRRHRHRGRDDRPAGRVRLAPGRRDADHHGDLRDRHRARDWSA